MLHYVEMSVRFTNEYGDIDEPFYNSMESMYGSALKLIAEDEMKEKFQHRCDKIVTDTRGIGWVVHDVLSDMSMTHLSKRRGIHRIFAGQGSPRGHNRPSPKPAKSGALNGDAEKTLSIRASPR